MTPMCAACGVTMTAMSLGRVGGVFMCNNTSCEWHVVTTIIATEDLVRDKG